MIALTPNILERNGEKAFVILPYEEYLLIEETLQEFADLQMLREAKAAEKDAPTRAFEEIAAELGIDLDHSEP
jgi:PHD/YefM family antitoxin component YafN of YafNO toxin-antitoxin module